MSHASPLADEAARLLEALQSWAGADLPPADEAHEAHEAHEALGALGAQEAPECRVCPVCQLLRVVRGIRPETVEHLAAASTELVAALRSMVDTVGAPTPAARRVVRIDVDE